MTPIGVAILISNEINQENYLLSGESPSEIAVIEQLTVYEYYSLLLSFLRTHKVE